MSGNIIISMPTPGHKVCTRGPTIPVRRFAEGSACMIGVHGKEIVAATMSSLLDTDLVSRVDIL
jgi:hypothetical protein